MNNIDVLSTEESIVSNLLQTPDLLGKLKVKPEMFENEGIKKFITYVIEEGKVDVNQIYFKSRKDKSFISTQRLSQLYDSKQADKTFFMSDQMNILQNYVLKKALADAKDYQSSPTPQNLKLLTEQLNELNELSIQKDNPTDNFLTEVMDNILSDKRKTFIKTGINSIDSKIIGFESGQLNVLGARPSLGKTSLALTMMWHIARTGIPTTFFSLETDGSNIVERLVAMMTNIPLHKIKRGDGLKPEEVDKVMQAIDVIKKQNHLRIEDKAQLTPSDIREVAMQSNGKPNVIFIDYLTLMSSDTPQKDRRLEVEKISRDLKVIAKETRSTIIALSQLSRGVESRQDKRPLMSDLREAGGIEQDANMIFFLYREDYYDKDLVDNDTGKSDIEFIIAKNKDGETGTVDLEFYKKTQRFYG
ncbi:DnaB helicase C-terminal domain-containing protein [Staphylococcus pettenkoferi]|uniref:DnaB helicase C-terminal domain-containing protein n=1 Tax=Staphylococcus pettenkoferi TaxID=170573 RepID=UPI0022739938|nr:DnaB helicase C-terminal domain-containing protein [Staphylococcus pettenkoferi]MCY1589877.1 DnaB helicase C-terminal domain-containing protein [Staphylococcus pettenkoferi]MCY1599267.1 DnaB helicase C-terminal domain-containing protein [Staphylococcus pettenkoferi]MCY1613759.1 DnaB helicase C-terminal domain-containing protein [Staphylococcus pettenkoferi]MCY1617236.1 DnaB helicase C-terminal domain-containing protein [Staphylococcus pettenkoferi]